MKEHQDKFTTSLVYLSDHGESLGEDPHLSRSALCHGPRYLKTVPMLLWLSRYQKRYQF
ncbi:sulfatase-like hydrolase/transferase [Escherichia coli]